ncbi:MAG: Uma2 family endonuclease [Eubacteriales bacterium]|nr:Uma2 family endonuclease [Eubacteriales bacterium]
MPLPKQHTYTSEDYWNLPDGERAELIDGQLYNLAAPSRIHQELVSELTQTIGFHIKSNNGSCKVYPAPFAVNLNADDKTYVEPDISIICDRSKLSDRGCEGAPDWIVEIVSPSSRRMDYSTKNTLYSAAGVREYWIIDPDRQRTTVYRYSEDDAPMIYTFDQPIPVGIYPGLAICIADLLA